MLYILEILALLKRPKQSLPPPYSSRGRSESKLSYQFYWWGRLLSPISKKNPKYKVGLRIKLAFLIHLIEKDYVLIEEIKNLFLLQVGSLHRSLKAKSILFKVYYVKDLRVIKNYFDKYPMITEGCSDYKLFSLVYELV